MSMRLPFKMLYEPEKNALAESYIGLYRTG